MKRFLIVAALAFLLIIEASPPAQAGRIVLTNDEWMLSDEGFSKAGTQPRQFALNVANWFTGGGKGDFLVYSTNFGLTGDSLREVMTGAGYTWTVSSPPLEPNPTFDYLKGFDGIFLAENHVDNQTLIDYVNAGGNVFLAGGMFSPEGGWNIFLNYFGLGLEGEPYNNITGSIPISSSHPIFEGVTGLYQDIGQDTLDIDPSGLNSQVTVIFNGHGLYAIYDPGITSVPEPGLMILLGSGLASLIGLRKKLRK